VAVRYAFALVPIGFGVWLAHYGFHLLTGVFTVVPVTQSAVIDLVGFAAVGDPRWRWIGLRPGLVFPLQLGCVLLGALGSLAAVQAISRRDYPIRATAAGASWSIVVALLAAAAMWVLWQPMDMRGTGLGG
jgi:hypothetical protein